jgi:dihydropteroate synthase
MTKRLTAANIRRETVTGLTEWFQQSDNMLEVAAEDAEAAIRMVTDEGDTDDSDSVDVEGDAQEDMNRTITFSVANPTARGESLFLAHSTRK